MKKALILITLFFLVSPSVSRGDYPEAINKGHYKAALNELIPLAEKGDASARFYLGVMYYKGQGVPQDYEEAAKWFLKAADQGEAFAPFNLGLMYYKGKGVPQDYVKAHMWFNLAAAQGDEKAAKRKDMVAQMMKPDQIAEAQRLAREFTSKLEKSKSQK